MAAITLVMLVALFFLTCYHAYAENAFDKLERGLINSATGWLEIPKNIQTVTEESNAWAGATYGTVKGTGMALVRTGAGAYDTGTFVIPSYDKPILEPKYVFSHE